ncbi:MAG TPA: hypothetical protein VLB49_00610 [Gemmatimonadales bacterium]|nr:hypothetical protein [Gemmatimonadales bacterium]
MSAPGSPSRGRWRSVTAVLAGFFAVVVLSLGTDQMLHVFQIYPPWGQPMYDPGLNLLALAYRCVYAAVGGYLTARLAPRAAIGHVLVLGVIGFVLGAAGAVTAIPQNLGPIWYPIALALTALPCVWLGGVLLRRHHAGAAVSLQTD